jgi:RNA polymerase sigma-70 factor (sigma-E family)
VGPEEEADFAAYVTARREHVRRTAYLLCRDWHKADDLTQIAFVKLYGAWDRVRDRRALDAYVRSCLVRATVDESRRPWRRETTTEQVPEGGSSAAPAGFGRPASHERDTAAAVLDSQLMQQALGRVPPGQRTVLVLRFYSGLDVAAVASELGCSEGNVKSQTARGLQALKAALGPEGLAAFGAGPSGRQNGTAVEERDRAKGGDDR